MCGFVSLSGQHGAVTLHYVLMSLGNVFVLMRSLSVCLFRFRQVLDLCCVCTRIIFAVFFSPSLSPTFSHLLFIFLTVLHCFVFSVSFSCFLFVFYSLSFGFTLLVFLSHSLITRFSLSPISPFPSFLLSHSLFLRLPPPPPLPPTPHPKHTHMLHHWSLMWSKSFYTRPKILQAYHRLKVGGIPEGDVDITNWRGGGGGGFQRRMWIILIVSWLVEWW